MKSLFFRVAAVAAVGVMVGCQPSQPKAERLAPKPVTGVVLLNGKAAEDVAVSFQSLDGQIACRGMTDDRGEFTLSTYGPSDGAPPGKYRVVISVDEFEVSPEGRPVPKAKKRTGPPIPVKYTRPDETPLTAEIKADGPNRVTLELR